MIAAALPVLVRSAEEEFDPDTVTPGIWGFVLTFLRRVNYRAEVREQLEAERAAQEVQALEGDFAAPDAPEPGTEPGTPPKGEPAAASDDDEDQPPAR